MRRSPEHVLRRAGRVGAGSIVVMGAVAVGVLAGADRAPAWGQTPLPSGAYFIDMATGRPVAAQSQTGYDAPSLRAAPLGAPVESVPLTAPTGGGYAFPMQSGIARPPAATIEAPRADSVESVGFGAAQTQTSGRAVIPQGVRVVDAPAPSATPVVAPSVAPVVRATPAPLAYRPQAPTPYRAASPAPRAAAVPAARASEGPLVEFGAVLRAAYLNNPTLKAGRAQLVAVGENVAQARAGQRASVTATGTLAYNTTFNDGLSQNLRAEASSQSAQVSVNQPLYDGGQAANAIESARAGVASARAVLSDTEQRVLLQAATAYIDVLRDQEIVDLTIQSARTLQGQLEATRARFELGELTRTDVAQAEASLADARAAVARARGALRVSQETFRAAVGAPAGRLTDPPRLPRIPRSRELSLRLALEKRADIAQAEADVRAAAFDLRQRLGGRLPTVDAGASATHNSDIFGSGQSSSTIGLSLTITAPLYQGGALNSRIRQAQAVLAQRRAQAAAVARDAAAAVATAWSNLVTARASIAAGREQIRANEVAFEGVSVEIEVGARSVSDLLTTERALLNARISLVRATRDLHAAVYDLTRSVGRMTPEALNVGRSFASSARVEPIGLRGYQRTPDTQWRFPWRP